MRSFLRTLNDGAKKEALESIERLKDGSTENIHVDSTERKHGTVDNPESPQKTFAATLPMQANVSPFHMQDQSEGSKPTQVTSD